VQGTSNTNKNAVQRSKPNTVQFVDPRASLTSSTNNVVNSSSIKAVPAKQQLGLKKEEQKGTSSFLRSAEVRKHQDLSEGRAAQRINQQNAVSASRGYGELLAAAPRDSARAPVTIAQSDQFSYRY